MTDRFRFLRSSLEFVFETTSPSAHGAGSISSTIINIELRC
jgi:hypothetical protein